MYRHLRGLLLLLLTRVANYVCSLLVFGDCFYSGIDKLVKAGVYDASYPLNDVSNTVTYDAEMILKMTEFHISECLAGTSNGVALYDVFT
jgi:hypothetical protein